VRVAIALVAGQAALCAVIGYVTLGAPHPHRAAPSAASPNPLAGGPIAIPPIPAPTIAPATRSRARPPAPRRRTVERVFAGPTSAAPAPRETVPPPSPTPVPTPPSPVAPSPPSPTATPTGGSLLASSPTPAPIPTPSGVQQGVLPGDPCGPPGSDGVTLDGAPVRCLLRVDDGSLRWQLV
jgi:hypothetical protein